MKKTFVEYRVNVMPCFVQLQAIRSESFFFNDLEESISFVIEFFGWSLGMDVGRF